MLLSLNDFSVVVRYPSHVSLEEKDAIKALEAVKKIRNSLARYQGYANPPPVIVDRLEQFAGCADWSKARIVD